MKLKICVSVSFLVLLISSCNSGSEKAGSPTVRDTTAPGMKIMIPGMVCYAGVVGKDSVFLKTEIFPSVVTGSLVYNFNEKDDSKGEIDGTMHGDTLIAEYRFGAEGKVSTREVAFLVLDSSAIEGYGPMEEKDGKMVFRNRTEIVFGNGFNLKAIACPLQ
jgi:hypothetical protein